ncbi:MAG: RNA polymerase sigma factor [Gaiellaceae bacterium]
MAAVPSIGRATRVERPGAPGAAAATDLYERYSGQIFGYCLHQLGSREEAEDAAQTTFMNAFRGLQRGIVPELESAWLFKIAHNVCLSRRRSAWRRGRVEAPNNFEVLQEIVPGREHVADELIRLQDVLEEMPETQRRAILLREWQGLTYREISDELGLSQAAVETLIFRARRALAQGLEQDAVTWKKRLRRGADVGGAIACAKTLLGGGGAAAIKIGTTTALVATAAVAAATAPVLPKPAHAHHARAAETAARLPLAESHARSTVAAPQSAPSASPATATKASVTSRPHASALTRTPRPAAVTSPAVDQPDTTSTSTPSAPAATPPAAPAADTQSVEAPPAPEAASLAPPAAPPAPAPPTEPQPLPAADPTPDAPGNKPDSPGKGEKSKPEHPDHPDNGKGKDH